MTPRSCLRSIWEAWKRVAKRVGDFQARALLTLFYFFILAPFALVIRLGSDPLAIKSSTPKGWRQRSDREPDPIRRAASQF